MGIKNILIISAAVLGATLVVLALPWQHPTSMTNSNTPIPQNVKTAMLAGGCFWCVESDLALLPGVLDVVSGYAGGTTKNPTYQNYADGGHREVILATYDPEQIAYAHLVGWLIVHSDPTDARGSFGDRGEQYAPAVYYETEEEKQIAETVIAAVDAESVYDKPLALSVLPRITFWPAEEYHQDYAQKNPVRYKFYRHGSGRDAFIQKYWGDNAARIFAIVDKALGNASPWTTFQKPSDAALRSSLTPVQYKVTQQDGTEPAFDNPYNDNKEPGIYVDVVSGEPLFSSRDKFDSDTGWPSFMAPIDPGAVRLKTDRKLFFSRTEVRSQFADTHLGHLFDDGPKDRGGKRYCMNSAALTFIPKNRMEAEGYSDYLDEVE